MRGAGRGPAGARRTARSGPPPLPPYLERLGLRPRKALGQHFLIDEFLLGDIVAALGAGPGTTVLEVGAGPGGLTEELLGSGARVVAVELDEELAALTRARLSPAAGERLAVVAADILDHRPEELLAEGHAAPPYVACGNLPYYITQPVVRRLLEAEHPPERLVVLVQREVAQRMVGGGGRESMLSMSVKCYGRPEYLFDVPDRAFWPRPKVQSAVVRIERLAEPPIAVPGALLPRFFQLLRAGYAEPRKQLRNAIGRSLGLPPEVCAALLSDAGIDPAARAQHVDLPAWERLFVVLEDRFPAALDAGLGGDAGEFDAGEFDTGEFETDGFDAGDFDPGDFDTGAGA